MSDYRREFGLSIGFIDHLQIVTTNKYNAIAISILYKIMLYFPAHSIFTTSCLVTASNNCYSSASDLKFSLKVDSLPDELF
jgi:hypothetical protein